MATRSKRNWKKEKDYKDMERFNGFQWAWEFLRRNTEYIKKWQEVIKKFPEVDRDFTLGPSAPKWGLEGYFNPSKDAPPLFEGLTKVIIRDRSDNSGIPILAGPLLKREGIAECSFDLNQPIVLQITLVKKILLNIQKRFLDETNKTRTQFKPHRDEWITLIRILDALAADAKDKEIAMVLFPPKCPVDEKADKCPLDEATDKHPLDDEAASKCPLQMGGSGKCALEDPAAGIKKVGDKKEQAWNYANRDYRLIPYSGK